MHNIGTNGCVWQSATGCNRMQLTWTCDESVFSSLETIVKPCHEAQLAAFAKR